jgi:thymidylate synthase (methanogen type)
MKLTKIGYDGFLEKKVIKIAYEPNEIPSQQLFNKSDVIVGNPSSNIAICFVYTWDKDSPPPEVMETFAKSSNYAALTGYWRTTNGGRYAFANILANPNINKILVAVFENEDNGHLLVDSLVNLWKYGIDEKGIIVNSKAPNPKFEQVPAEALERIRKQADLLVLKNIKDSSVIQKALKAMIQEPGNAVDTGSIKGAELISNVVKNERIYDDGARFTEPYIIDLSKTAKKAEYHAQRLTNSVGQSIQAKNLDDGIKQAASFVFKNGSSLVDERGIVTIESRSFTITVLDPLEKIPEGFSKEYIEKYVEEFMEGKGEKLDEFAYTYHERIFKKWGNQPEKVTEALKNNPNTRRALINLWDPASDIQSSSPPCLDFIWFVIRNSELEMHVVYRSHHLATVTKDGKIMEGEGAFVPNLYALATLQDKISKELKIKRGPLVLTDFSGHLYVSDIS